MLAIIIALLSGAWPYVKLLLMLYCWLAPVVVLPPAMRLLVLRVLDAAGKWSLLDFLMLMMMAVAFHFTLELHSTPLATGTAGGAPPYVLRAQLYVMPGFGMVSFLIAACMSLALSHVLLAMHLARDGPAQPSRPTTPAPDADAAGGIDRAARPASSKTPVPLCNYRFAQLMYVRGLRLPLVVQAAVPIILVACGVTTLAAASVNAFTLHFEGLVGGLLEASGGETKSFSLLSLSTALLDFGRETEGTTMSVLPYAFIVLTLGVPLVWLAQLLTLWVLPLSRLWQMRLLSVAEVLQAWSALDVFLLTVVASLMELDKFAHFIVDDLCAGVNGVLEDYFSGGDLVPGEASCFGVKATMEGGTWMLLAVSIVSMAVGHFVMHVGNRARDEWAEQHQRPALR